MGEVRMKSLDKKSLDNGTSRPLATILIGLVLGLMATSMSVAQRGQVQAGEEVLSIRLDESSRSVFSASDYLNARPLPLPRSDHAPTDARRSEKPVGEGQPGSAPGNPGSGRQRPEVLIPRSMLESAPALPQRVDPAYGTSERPFSTSRADLTGNNVSSTYPYRAAGRLFFTDGSLNYSCTASLIKKGVLITAAHCVYNNVAGAYYAGFVYVPAYRNGLAPYGSWTASATVVFTSYQTQATCLTGGVVCTTDIAVIILAQQSGAWVGTATGWFGYGWNGYGFTPANLAQIKQLGYPTSHDSGKKMIETDAQADKAGSELLDNTQWGSSQTAGSSGGPLVVNFGKKPKYQGTKPGEQAKTNRVVGVASWAYSDSAIKHLGASRFTKPLIKTLVYTACAQVPKPC